MAKRLNIGIYIGAGDLDIAAWFNLLKDYGLPRSKWVVAILDAYKANIPLDIGSVDIAALVPSDDVSESYGWHIRGKNGEYVVGSVINVSIARSDIMDTVNMVWSSGNKLATYIKSLIRNSLIYGNANIPPKPTSLYELYSQHIVRIPDISSKSGKGTETEMETDDKTIHSIAHPDEKPSSVESCAEGEREHLFTQQEQPFSPSVREEESASQETTPSIEQSFSKEDTPSLEGNQDTHNTDGSYHPTHADEKVFQFTVSPSESEQKDVKNDDGATKSPPAIRNPLLDCI